MSSTENVNVKTNKSATLTRWEEVKIRRLWYKLQGHFSAPHFSDHLKAEGIDLNKLDHGTIMRIVWEEIFVLYGEKLKNYESLKEQISNPNTDWNRIISPCVVGVDLKDEEGTDHMSSEEELAEALDAYTDPNHPEYDPVFDKKIRELRPDWFEEEDLAEALDAYTDPNHPEYDPAFDKEIRALRPDWFYEKG